MLSHCDNFSTQVAVLHRLLGDNPQIVVTGYAIDGTRYDLHLTGWNHWTLDLGDQQVSGVATNVTSLCRAAMRHCPARIVRLDFSITVGGNTWCHPTSLDLSNPEAVASGFAALFRKVLNEERQRQFGSLGPSSEGRDPNSDQ